ncbi:hypothetical protein PLUTE_a6001 [Pseudoalteromonas luteoviolacea DSM 6061]|nr:hypothetical protein [Pseudoalteromonas luteoviolacea DSM 6061]
MAKLINSASHNSKSVKHANIFGKISRLNQALLKLT